MRLELHPEARDELRSAALWYDERRSGLGDEFIAEISAALDRIGDVPIANAAAPSAVGISGVGLAAVSCVHLNGFDLTILEHNLAATS